MCVLLAIFLSTLVTVNCQRSPYAGSRPGSGYKDTYLGQPASSSTSGQNVGSINNRDGESSSTSATVGGTTIRLPVDAYGDKFIVHHYNNLPVEQRPFWILNQDQINLQRGTPQQQFSNNNGGNAGNSGSNAIQTSTSSVPAGNGGSLGDRFGENNNFNPYQQLPTVGNYPEVVYPSNSSPIQRIDLEIQYLQNRLQSLQNQRQQLTQQPQQQQQQSPTQNGQLNQKEQQLQQQRNRRSPNNRKFF